MRTPSSRVALFWLAYLLVLFAASFPRAMVPPAIAELAWGTCASIGILALIRLFRRWDETDPRSPNPDPSPNGVPALNMAPVGALVLGLGIGFAVYAATLFIISITVGPLTVSLTSGPPKDAAALRIVSVFALAIMEELGFRGYTLRTLLRAHKPWLAHGIVVVVFGLSHLLFGWHWQTVVMGVMPSAVLFGASAHVSRGLAMPIGVHTAVNLAQWIAGEKPEPGWFVLGTAAAHESAVAAAAPLIGAAVPILTAAALWRWWPRAAK